MTFPASPALVEISPPDLWAFLASKNLTVARLNYLCVLEDVRHGRCFGVRAPSGAIAAIGSITPAADVFIAWVSVSPSGIGRPLPLRSIRSFIAMVAKLGPVLAVVDDDDARACRLAQAVGFVRVGDATVTGKGVWQCRH